MRAAGTAAVQGRKPPGTHTHQDRKKRTHALQEQAVLVAAYRATAFDAHLSSTSASQHSASTTSSNPSPRGLVWSASGGSKQENVGAALAQQTNPRAMARDPMSERMMMFVLVLGKDAGDGGGGGYGVCSGSVGLTCGVGRRNVRVRRGRARGGLLRIANRSRDSSCWAASGRNRFFFII